MTKEQIVKIIEKLKKEREERELLAKFMADNKELIDSCYDENGDIVE